MRLFAKCCLVFVLLLGFSVMIKAEPIRIQPGSTASFNLSAGSFNLTDVNGNRYVGSSIGSFRLPSYQPGSIFNPTVNFFQTFGSNDFRGIYNNGTPFPVVYIAGQNSSLTFSSASFQLPALSGLTFSVTIPFTMQGILTPIGDCFGTPLCNTTIASNNLTGNGTATYNFSSNLLSQDNKWQLTGANYAFSSPTPEPTPEPTTLLLFGTGIAGVIGYARRKRKSSLTK